MSFYEAALPSPPVMRLTIREWPLPDLGIEDDAGPLSQLPTRVRERPAGATVRAPSWSSRPTLTRVNVDVTRVNLEVQSMERATEPANVTLVSPAPVEPEERTKILMRPPSSDSIAMDRSTLTAVAGFSPTIPAPTPSPVAGPRPSMVSFVEARLTAVPVPPSSARATLLPPISVAPRSDRPIIAGALAFVVALGLVMMGATTANNPQIRNLVAHSTFSK